MKHYLTVDLGTGNTRVALVRSDGAILAIETFTNRYYRDAAYGDAQYFLPGEWAESILGCCARLHRLFPDIRADAVSSAGARQSIVLLDKDGRAYYGLPNIDNRGRDYMSLIENRDEIYALSGKWVTEDFCAAKLMGLRLRRPELYSLLGTVLSISEWIAYIFTGVRAMEHSQACETQLYDLAARRWSERLCGCYGVDIGLLPPLMPAGSVVGRVLPEQVSAFGMADGAVFIMGGADTQTALRQTGLGEGDIAVVSGTTSPVAALCREKYYDAQQRVWTDANLGGESFIVEMNPGVTGLNYQRIKAGLCADLSYEELEAAYAAKTDFSCTASFSSLLFYERRSLKNGGFFMRSPLGSEPDRVDMAWAVLADIACSIYEQLSRLMALTGCESRRVLCCGGGFRSAALCRMLSDLSGLELLLRPGFEQATIAGLVSLCNDRFGLRSGCDGAAAATVYSPRRQQLIHSYYPVWLENRSRANRSDI